MKKNDVKKDLKEKKLVEIREKIGHLEIIDSIWGPIEPLEIAEITLYPRGGFSRKELLYVVGIKDLLHERAPGEHLFIMGSNQMDYSKGTVRNGDIFEYNIDRISDYRTIEKLK